jgi:hypothetical protein
MEKDKKDTKNIMIKKKDFIWNALEDGWTIKKKEDSYIFLKDHEGKKEVFTESYLRAFIVQNLNGGKNSL